MAEGHVVARYKIGNTRVSICDDYAVKTQEEKKAILDRIMDIFAPYYNEETFVDEPLKFDEEAIEVDENWLPIKKRPCGAVTPAETNL